MLTKVVSIHFEKPLINHFVLCSQSILPSMAHSFLDSKLVIPLRRDRYGISSLSGAHKGLV